MSRTKSQNQRKDKKSLQKFEMQAFQLPSLHNCAPTLTQIDDEDDGNEEEQVNRSIMHIF